MGGVHLSVFFWGCKKNAHSLKISPLASKMMGAFLCGCFPRIVDFPQIIHFNRRFSLIFTIHFGGIPPLFLDSHPWCHPMLTWLPGPPCCHVTTRVFPSGEQSTFVDLVDAIGSHVSRKSLGSSTSTAPWSGPNHRWCLGWVGWLVGRSVGRLVGWLVGFVLLFVWVCWRCWRFVFCWVFLGGCLNRTERMSGLAEGKW